MGLLQRTADYFDRWVDRVVCVGGAVVFAQAPEFMQQYLQRLGGHLDEARRMLAELVQVASRSGRDPLVWAAEARSSVDPVTADLGRLVLETSARVDQLSRAKDALSAASAWERPFTFLAQVDVGILRGTWSDYLPAVPTTTEGGLYALCGMTFAWVLYAAALRPAVGRLLRRRAPGRGGANSR